jgi:Flp pilus assembly protein TadG
MGLVFMIVLLGFAALTIDVGVMYNARGDLQRSADAAALAAASVLSEYELGDTVSLARTTAEEYVAKNHVLGKTVQATFSDVTFLRSHYDADLNEYTFRPMEVLPDAVRVNVELSETSPNGPLGLFFAAVFGRLTTNVSASAVAGMIPRDIAIVADLSASHTDDSELRKYRFTAINMYDVWAALPGGLQEVDSVWYPHELPPYGDVTQAAGPAWGYMKKLGFGEMDVDPTYDPVSDPGLVRLAYQQDWNDANLSAYLAAQQYSPAEITAILQGGATDTSSSYPIRVAVALGLASWNSGMPGGRWFVLNQPAGNGNSSVTSSEIVWTESIMGRAPSESASLWTDYIGNYMTSTSNTMYNANAAFRYRFGIKTLVNYVLEKRTEPHQTPELANVPTQPMQAVKDGITHMMAQLIEMEAHDLVSLEGYSTVGRHEVDLTDDFGRLSSRLNEMQAANYGHFTCIGCGLERAIEELSSPRARSMSKKVIVLYTDGIANINRSGDYDPAGAKQYAWDMAVRAAARGFRIYAVSVGSEPDLDFMDRIAERGDGQHYHAEGSIEEYSAELDRILNALSSKRSVQLIQ